MAAAMAAATSSPVSGPGGGDVGDGTGEVRLLQRRHRDRSLVSQSGPGNLPISKQRWIIEDSLFSDASDAVGPM